MKRVTTPAMIAAAATMPIFANVPRDDLVSLLTPAHVARFEGGDTLFTQGSNADSILVLIEGSVDILVRGGSGIDRPIAHLGEGAVLGETSLLTGAPHSATARATELTQALQVPYERLHRMREADEQAAHRVIYNVARILAQRLRDADAELADLCDRAQGAIAEDDLERLRRIFFAEWGTSSRH